MSTIEIVGNIIPIESIVAVGPIAASPWVENIEQFTIYLRSGGKVVIPSPGLSTDDPASAFRLWQTILAKLPGMRTGVGGFTLVPRSIKSISEVGDLDCGSELAYFSLHLVGNHMIAITGPDRDQVYRLRDIAFQLKDDV